MNIAVVALGKIGLPLAAQFAAKGHRVVGCDVNPAAVDAVNAGRSHVSGEEGLAERVAEAHAKGLLRATLDTAAAVRESEAVVVIVPVMLDGENRPDLAAMEAATEAIGRGLRPGTLVIYETTLPVGTTRNRLGPILERCSGLRMGADFHLAYSPERVYSGRIFRDLQAYPKVVGGIDPESTRRAEAFYRAVLDAEILTVRDAETAEFVKLAETTYRDVNIAFANELARLADTLGVDVTEAIAAANTQPFSMIHAPGVGVGGHCIPVYPHFLISELSGPDLAVRARRVNDGMAEYAAERLERALGGLAGRTVLILGLSYRANVKEAAYSSTFLLDRALAARGARVLVHDPWFSDDEVRGLGLAPAPFPPEGADALVVQAYHDEYRGHDLTAVPGVRAVLDGRGVLDRAAVEAKGVVYVGLGR